MWTFQPSTDHTNPKVRGWSISPTASGQFATALSRCIAPPGATTPAARRALYTRSSAAV
jgi:hypothetical protein